MENGISQNIKGYELQERIAAGGFGAVYKARQSTLGREVAVKVILPSLASKPDFIRRFEAEAQLVARLEHMNIVPLFDYWREPDGAYLVMRYMRGGSLHNYLHNQGSLPIEDAYNMLSQVAQGLHVAHRSQVIHRDIKPGNILLDEDGNGYLGDFGIAKDYGNPENLTAPDSFVGSAEYLAPEQARSEPVTPRTDIYSLGVVLYEMLVGDHPFPGLDTVSYIFKHIQEPLPEVTTLDDNIQDAVNAVIQKATAKDPKHRYEDVIEMVQALRQAAQLDATPTPTSLVELLTPREQEVMQLIIDGKTNREIADILVLTEGTVKQYVSSIYRKLKVRSRVQAIARARDLNFLVKKPEVVINTEQLPEPINPYKGLQAFQAADAQDFFGREKLVNKLLSRLSEDVQHQRFLAIVGPSGSGKSSVVKAGLVPALWRGELPGSDNWYVVDLLPGDRPLDELEVSLLRVAGNQNLNLREQLERDTHGLQRVANLILPDDDSELLVVIDQFEEVFTLVENDADRQHFLNLLLHAITDSRSRVRVVVTLRADYYDRPLQHPDFGELMRNRIETVLPLSADELEQVIRKPAEKVGVTFDEGLVSQIVSDVHYQTGALPLLQYALTELFERRDGRKLTYEAYQTIGGTGGALAKRADEIYLEADEDGQELIRQMFMRLVTLGEGAEDTRRRVNRTELLDLTPDSAIIDEIIDLYAQSRLLALDHDPATRQPTVEVAHEAILREWDTLRAWLNESREDIRQERTFAQVAAEWQAHDNDPAFLLTGTRLEQAQKWGVETSLTITPLLGEFIQASTEENDRQRVQEQERLARETALDKRSRNLLRTLVAVFGIATAAALVLALYIGSQNQLLNAAKESVEEERDRAETALVQADRSAAEFRSIALSFGAQDAINSGQPDAALALAQEAINMENPPPAAQEMFYHVSSSSRIRKHFDVSDANTIDALYLPDGDRIVTISRDGRTIVWDIETGEELQSIESDNRRAIRSAVNPQGNIVVIPALDGPMQIWNLETNEIIEQQGHVTPAFNSDGTLMVTENFGNINIWETETFTRLDFFPARAGEIVFSLQFSPDDSMLIASTSDSTVRVWDLETHELLSSRQFEPREFASSVWIWNAIMLSDMEHVLVATAAGEVALWNWRADEIVWTITQNHGVQDIAISPDEQTFVLGMDNQVASSDDPTALAELREVSNR